MNPRRSQRKQQQQQNQPHRDSLEFLMGDLNNNQSEIVTDSDSDNEEEYYGGTNIHPVQIPII